MRTITRNVLGLSLIMLISACGAEVEAELEGSAPTQTSAAENGDGESLGLIVLPGDDGQLPADTQVGCESGPYFPVSALGGSKPLDASEFATADEIEQALASFLETGEGNFWAPTDWRILHETSSKILVVHIGKQVEAEGQTIVDPERISTSFMDLENLDGEWVWSGSQSGGDCIIVTATPDRYNTVEWNLPPDSGELDADATEVEVLLTERECVSGQQIGDRLLGPEIIFTDTQVLLSFAAEPPGGDVQTCPGIAGAPFTVRLDEPLGERELTNGQKLLGKLQDHIGQDFEDVQAAET